jgi:hypothetical protein
MKVRYYKMNMYSYSDRIYFTFNYKEYIIDINHNSLGGIIGTKENGYYSETTIKYQYIDDINFIKEIEIEDKLLENLVNSQDPVLNRMIIEIIKNECKIL